jgi:hypothetical protein
MGPSEMPPSGETEGFSFKVIGFPAALAVQLLLCDCINIENFIQQRVRSPF